jgi:hypothetical protein
MMLSPLGEIPRILFSDRVSGLRNRWLAFLGVVRTRFYRSRIMLKLCLGGNPAHLSGSWNRK